jgi:hypothetical protein
MVGRTPWIPAFVAFVLAAAGIYAGPDGDYSKFVVPNVPDLTIKTRETIDCPQSVRTNTLYFQGTWQRRELHLQFPSALPAQRTVRHASMIEAWWRSLKHQWLFLHSLDSVTTVRRLVEFSVQQHNRVLPHSAFRGQTPDEMYFGTGDGSSRPDVTCGRRTPGPR